MRPTAARQSALRFPLNDIFGREANVRVLRALVESSTPLDRGRVSAAAELSATGASRALAALVETGVIEAVGQGSYAFRAAHPLATPIRSLFEAETRRACALQSRLKELMLALEPSPIAAWIEGPFADGKDVANEPVRVSILTTTTELSVLRAGALERLGDIEREHDVMIHPVFRTRADLEVTAASSDLENVLLLSGPPPASIVAARRPSRAMRSRPRTHAARDAELRRIGKHLATIVRKDSSVIARAARYVGKRLESEERPAPDLREWLHILETNSPAQIARLLESDSQRAQRLRRSPVFLPVLSPSHRRRIEAAMKDSSEERKRGARA